MTSALQAVTVNFINTKLKMEDTLEENIRSECTTLRGNVMQIVLELRNSGISPPLPSTPLFSLSLSPFHPSRSPLHSFAYLVIVVNVSSEELPSQAIIFQLAYAANGFVDTMQKVSYFPSPCSSSLPSLSPFLACILPGLFDKRYVLDSIATLRYVMMSENSFSGAIKINDGVSRPLPSPLLSSLFSSFLYLFVVCYSLFL